MPRQSCHSSSFPPLSSFPRKRESRPPDATGIYRKNRNPRHRHSRESGNLDPKRGRNLSEKTETPAAVIPAKAGIQTPTQQESIGKNRNPRRRHSRAGGNPDPKRGRNLSEKTDPPPPSFPRRRESRPQTRQESIEKNRPPATVIPAQAGIQTPNAAGIYRKKPTPRHRHSRAGGNPDPKRGRNLSETAETERTGFPPARE